MRGVDIFLKIDENMCKKQLLALFEPYQGAKTLVIHYVLEPFGICPVIPVIPIIPIM